MLEIDSKHLAGYPNETFVTVVQDICEKSAVKYSKDKPILLIYLKLRPIFLPKISERIYFRV